MTKRPPSLREFLDSGADFASIPGLDPDYVGTVICVDDREWRPSWKSSQADILRRAAEAFIDGTPLPPEWPPGQLGPRDTAHVAGILWSADALDDPSLADRLYEALPPEVREKVSADRDERRRPRPLVIEDTDESQCDSCGVWFSGQVVVVGHRPGYSEEIHVTYCADCIRMAALALTGDVVPIS